MAFLSVHELSFIFGILGNVISFLVFLSPIPTFYRIYKRKSSHGFKSLPYVIGLFSASLLLYYGVVKTHAFLIISINSAGCVIEIIYITLYVVYATKEDKIFTLMWILVTNIGCLGLIMGLTLALTKGTKRVSMVGWACAVINIAVFAAPMSVMWQVIKTKSVEYLPIGLSICLTLNATAWFFFGFFIKDYFISLPNVLGFVLGIIQIIIYLIYKNGSGSPVELHGEVERKAEEEGKKDGSIVLELADATVHLSTRNLTI